MGGSKTAALKVRLVKKYAVGIISVRPEGKSSVFGFRSKGEKILSDSWYNNLKNNYENRRKRRG